MTIKRLPCRAATPSRPSPPPSTSTSRLFTCMIENYKSLTGPGSKIEVVTELLANGLLQVSIVQTTEHSGEWCRIVLVSENGTSWDRIVRLVYQQSLDALSCRELDDYDDDDDEDIPFLDSSDGRQEQGVKGSFEPYLYSEESSVSGLDLDDDTSSYKEFRLEEGREPAFHYPVPALEDHFEYIYRPPPPPRPSPPPPPPPMISTPSDDLSIASQYTSRPDRYHQPQQETATVATEAQITIHWAGRGTLHILERIPLNRASIVGKALDTVRSGQYDFGGRNSPSGSDRGCPSPSRLHATLRRVEMGSESIHVTGRVETFGSLYAAAARREPGLLPVFVVHVRSDE